MKQLLFFILFTTASLYAMDQTNLHIVKYDPIKHSDRARRIFSDAFPDAHKTPEVLRWPFLQPQETVMILECDNEAAGLAIVEDKIQGLHDAFKDVIQSSNITIKTRMVDYIAIARKYRKTDKRKGKGFGNALLKHILQDAENKEIDIVSLHASDDSLVPFYLKNEFIQTMPAHFPYSLAIPLNEHMNAVLTTVIAERAQPEHVVPHPRLC